MRFSVTSRTALAVGFVLSIPLLTGANGSGCSSSSDGGGTIIAPCTPSACGSGLGWVWACPGGTTQGAVCQLASVNVGGGGGQVDVGSGGPQECAWVISACPTATCTTADCGPMPTLADACPNGGSSPSPVCVPTLSGCGWTFPPCATTTCSTSDCGPYPQSPFPFACDNGTPNPSPNPLVCEPIANNECAWVLPMCPAVPDDGACPTPQPCGATTECPCNDGTTQNGGCSSCGEACLCHGGGLGP